MRYLHVIERGPNTHTLRHRGAKHLHIFTINRASRRHELEHPDPQAFAEAERDIRRSPATWPIIALVEEIAVEAPTEAISAAPQPEAEKPANQEVSDESSTTQADVHHDDYESMQRGELLALAERREIAGVNPRMKRSDVIALLRAADLQT